MIYDVHVTAYGKSYGYDIPKESMFNNTSDAEVFVHNPEQNELPDPFSFKASCTRNQLNVAVSDAENTEYYLLRYKGPLNLGVSQDDEGTTVLAHAGLNQIKIETPKGSSTGEDQGLYLVEVVSVNKNNISPDFNSAWIRNAHYSQAVFSKESLSRRNIFNL